MEPMEDDITRLYQAVYEGDTTELRRRLLDNPSAIHALDTNGDSLMHLAIRTGSLNVVAELIACGFDVNTRSAAGWTIMEEAVAAMHHNAPHQTPAREALFRHVYHAVQADEQRRWSARRKQLLDALHSMPDFSLVLSWTIGSWMLGVSRLLRRFLPSDTYTMRKEGVRLRVDATLAGLDFNKLTWLRGELSLIVRFDAPAGEPEIVMLDHKRRRAAEYLRTWAYFKPEHGLDPKKEAALLRSGMQRETAEQVELCLTKHPDDSASGWGAPVGDDGWFESELIAPVAEADMWGRPLHDDASPIEGVSCLRYSFRCSLNAKLRERDAWRTTQSSYERHARAVRLRPEPPLGKANSGSDLSLLNRIASGGKVSGLFTRPVHAKASCAWGMPLRIEQFAIVLRLLAPINRHIAGICDYLVSIVPEGAFPTRLSVPLPVGFYLEALLDSYSADVRHSHASAPARNSERASSARVSGERVSEAPEGSGRNSLPAAVSKDGTELSPFDVPGDYDWVHEDEFLDDLLEQFLSTIDDDNDDVQRRSVPDMRSQESADSGAPAADTDGVRLARHGTTAW